MTTDLESRLKLEAARRGVSTDRAAAQILDRHLTRVERPSAAAMLLQWAAEADTISDEDADENAAVLCLIDEDRLSDRRLFNGLLPARSS